MYRLFLIVIIISLGNICCSQHSKKLVPSKDIVGTYVNKEDLFIHLEFSEQSFLVINTSENAHLPILSCSDTIAFGKWKMDITPNFIRLQSPEYLINSIINFEVEEHELKNTDSIYFEITNQIESHYKRLQYHTNEREITYVINIKSNREALMNKLNNKIINTNKVAIPQIGNGEITEIELIISNSEQLEGHSNINEFYTIPYEVEHSKTNYFTINIPDLSYCKIGAKPLNQDFIKIINKKTLEWDGNLYKKNK